MEDEVLVRLVLDGNKHAYAALAVRYAPRIHAICLARVSRLVDAEELAQETLYRGLRDLSTLNNAERFGPWLCSIARNVCCNWVRSRQHAPELFTDCESNGHAGQVPVLDRATEEAEMAYDMELLRAGLCALPEIYREVIRLFYSDRLTYKEMAALLGVSPATVNARLSEARERLRRWLINGQ
ncbi:MAG TPA: RNA polymerase sigma factor [Gemmataceae bacterium]|nr:RNA polymerase sigma factor [Gemmataceae bacterium]